MGLLEQIRKDVQFILTDSTASPLSAVTLTTPAAYDPQVTVTLNALAIKHSLPVYNDQNIVMEITRTARVTFSETVLSTLEYPVRNIKGEVQLKGHFVSFVDSAGLTYNGIINMVAPDRTTGDIVCTIGDRTIV